MSTDLEMEYDQTFFSLRQGFDTVKLSNSRETLRGFSVVYGRITPSHIFPIPTSDPFSQTTSNGCIIHIFLVRDRSPEKRCNR